jgi:hypothetical protein
MHEKGYKDGGGHSRIRFDREVTVDVSFWDYDFQDGDLYELAFVRSILQYFMQAYWKRSSKEGSRIELAKVLSRNDRNGKQESLCFAARQKDNRNYLQISLVKKGEAVKEEYLEGQEVIMLDIALGKALNLLTPTLDRSGDVFGY